MLLLVAHETANNSANADNHYTYFNNITIQASAHTFVDDKKILEIIPLTEKAWHVHYQKQIDNQMFGDDANDCAIGVELCRTGDFREAYKRYVWYFAYLCDKFNLQPKKHIVSHKTLDPGRKFDPQSWLEPNGVTWNQFIDDVQNVFNEIKGADIVDKNKPDKWAEKDWEEATKNGYFDGTRPKDNITRQEVAAVINRLRKKLK